MEADAFFTQLLRKHLADPAGENRFVEFKSNYQEADKIGQYISALSNGACLENEDRAYLYFGVEDQTHAVVGTRFDPAKTKGKGNQALELYLRQLISPKINFQFSEFLHEGAKRIVVITIPSAREQPTCFCNTPYIRVDSHVTKLDQYPDWMRAIYNSRIDWSAQIVAEATLGDLDPQAIAVAREGYKKRFPDFASEADQWSDSVFLDKAGITREGQITRTALLLLGKAEAACKTEHIAQMVWKCRQGEELIGDTYTTPFILTTSQLFSRIRNYRFKIFPHNSLIPAEVWKYDTQSVLEALHNCIAHQDYLQNERILVNEDNDKLTFTNAGSFYEGTYQRYVLGTSTPAKYRNPFLMKAMVNVKMIDSQGYGIHNMFLSQRQRYLPMPDYDDSAPDHVVVQLPGTIIDPHYSLMLLEKHDIRLDHAILLDRVQKGKPISRQELQLLRKHKWVEGRMPHIYIARNIAQTTGRKVEYSHHKGLDAKKCEALLVSSLTDHPSLTKKEITDLLWNVLPDQLTDNQRRNKIDNLLRKLRQQAIIANTTRGSRSQWTLVKT